MAPQTRTTRTSHPRKNQGGGKTSSATSSSISKKRETEKKKLKKMGDDLANLEKKYNEAGPEKQSEMQNQIDNQRRVVKEQEENLERMDVDSDDDEPDKPRKGGMDVDKEQGDENPLFVDGDDHADGDQGGRETHKSPPGKKSSSPEEDSGYESNDDIGRVATSDLESGGKLDQYFKGSFGHYYGVYQHGPRNAARQSIRKLAEKGKLPEELKKDQSKDMDRNSKIPMNGKAEGNIHRVLGLALLSTDEDDRMDSLNPQNWRTANGGSCVKPMKVHVRWFDENGPESWEWRGAVKRQMYAPSAKYPAPRTIEYNGKIIVEKGIKIHKADFFLIDTAVRLEKRHDEWKDGGRKRADRDPTPGLPLRSEQEEVSPKEEL